MEQKLVHIGEGTTAPNASAEQQHVEYEVFLSFRGPDVRKSFADFLYSYLVRSKIRTFRDEEELQKGETIAPSLVQAITESKIYIPILSKSYASSKWCLQELAKMVECCRKGKGHIIFPVFYFMDPRDVRHQAGPYEEAFEQHSKKHDAVIIQDWRIALQEVGQMKGWHVTELDGQGAVIDEVFSKVELHLRANYTLVTDELVGIDFHVQEVMRLLNNIESGDGKIVGIQGIGGMGKTTIAKAVFDKICANFDRCCFLENIRDLLSKSDGITSLQNKLISSILRVDFQVKDASEGVKTIRERVCKYKVLVVLDDVDDTFEFGQILGKLGNFSLESRFVITTRSLIKLDGTNRLWMHDLLRDLGRGIVIEEDVEYPSKRSRIWTNDDAIRMLKNKEGTDRVEMLRVDSERFHFVKLRKKCFERLSRLRYLDIHCPKMSLDGDFSGILPHMRWIKLSRCYSTPSNLNLKNVVILELHGWDVTDIWGGWNSIKELKDLEELSFENCDELPEIPGDIWQLQKLKTLRMVKCICKGSLLLDPDGILPSSLTCLIVDWSEGLTRLPNLGNLSNLMELRLFQFSASEIHGLENLRALEALEISGSVSLDHNLHGLENLLQNLKQLCISGWRRLPEFVEFGRLKSLQSLEMKDCKSLKRLSILSSLANLETLDVSGCIRLVDIQGLDRLGSLQKLNMSNCWSIEELPDISEMKSLKVLDVSECIKLVRVNGLEKLESLEELYMVDCRLIKELADMSDLKYLAKLNLMGCTELKNVEGLEKLGLLWFVRIEMKLRLKYPFKMLLWASREAALLAFTTVFMTERDRVIPGLIDKSRIE
ncbi:Disease resistance protein L6 [Linum grandiflorum]